MEVFELYPEIRTKITNCFAFLDFGIPVFNQPEHQS